MQVQTTSEITDKNFENNYGMDVSCNLGSLDIHNATKHENFEELVDTSNRLLVSVSDMTNIENVPSIKKANNLMHSVGLGVMNLHGHLVSQGIKYDSKEALGFTDLFMEALNYYSLKSSMEIAKERGQKFYQFEKSEYANGKYFDQYIGPEREYSQEAFYALGNVPLISNDMWHKLKKDVMKYGVYSAYRLAIAPTGSISYIRSSTASMAPITERVETRDYADSRTIYPMPFLTNENKELYDEAYDINQFKMIDLYATAQKHIDQGISMTVYIKDTWDTEMLTKLYAYAHSKQIKTIYYVRQRMQTLEECVSCSI